MNHIVKTESFLKFFSSATKLVEVAITEDSALGLDRYSDDLVAEDANELMSVQRIFHDEKWSKGRPVTSLDWYFVIPLLTYLALLSNILCWISLSPFHILTS